MKKKIRLLNGEYVEIDLSKTNVVFRPVQGEPGLYVMIKPKTEVPVYLESPKSERINARRDLEIFLTSLLKQSHIFGKQRGPSYLKMETCEDKVVFRPSREYILHGFCGKLWMDPSFAVIVSAPQCASVSFNRGKIVVNRRKCSKTLEGDKNIYIWFIGKPRRVQYTIDQILRVID